VDEGSGDYGTGGHGTAIGGWEYVVNPNSDKKEAAIELLRYTMTPEWNLAYFREIGRFPARPSTLESEEAKELEPVGPWTDAIAEAGTYARIRPVTPVWGDQESVIAREANAAYQGNKTAEEALTSAAEAFRSIEQSYSG
ncbi:MAG: extracellular solute-binding protein, partial [Natronomonas sp.]